MTGILVTLLALATLYTTTYMAECLERRYARSTVPDALHRQRAFR